MRRHHLLRRGHPRRGAAAVEFAIVAPIAFILLLGTVIASFGVFRYQEIAHLARLASRWASVHGTDYAKKTGNPAATATDVYNDVIIPNAKGLNPSNLTYSVTWNKNNSPFYTATGTGSAVKIANTVTVTINYKWVPEAYLGGLTMTSTSVATMSF